MKETLGIIGGGAAGFFAAINAAEKNSSLQIVLFEKSTHLLSKVKVSGGGRCNVTHACFDVMTLVEHYPRGRNELISCFNRFNPKHTVEWFEKRKVKLKIESDGRMFPVTDDSSTIINCLMHEAEKAGVKIITGTGVTKIEKRNEKFELTLSDKQKFSCDKVLISTGGFPNEKSYDWLKQLGVKIISPVPSLFTFNIPNSPFKGLEGISVETAEVQIEKTSFTETGPLLVTHWGLSGPVILKLSAFASREVFEKNYQFTAIINFIPDLNEEELQAKFRYHKNSSPAKRLISKPLYNLPQRLWERLCTISGISELVIYSQLSKTQMQNLIQNLIRCRVNVNGKTTFKEEFVTCGGVDLKDVNMKTMEHKTIANLFFAGEILNMDGVTGGFNFQAAWTTGWIAAEAIASLPSALADGK